MIYLITGNMGTGKTAMVVSMLLNNEDGLFKIKAEDGTEIDRPLYFCHIDGLDTKKFKAHELTEEQVQSAPLNELIPQGSVLLVDECDYVYPVRAAGRPVPPYIQTLKELRHEGYTLILMTQHPSMIDIYLRQLITKHIHLERKHLGTKRYEWYKCVTSLENPAGVSGTVSKWYKPDKKAFKYYKSASVHAKFKKSIPLAFWALGAVLILIGLKAYSVYGMYDKHTNRQDEASIQMTASEPAPAIAPTASQIPSSSAGLDPSQYIPTLSEKPESKPLYDSIRQVKNYERIAACISGGKSQCTCYSDQATPLKEITPEMCQNYAANGLPFDPFRDKAQQERQQTSTDTAAAAPPLAVMGGEDKFPLMPTQPIDRVN